MITVFWFDFQDFFEKLTFQSTSFTHQMRRYFDNDDQIKSLKSWDQQTGGFIRAEEIYEEIMLSERMCENIQMSTTSFRKVCFYLMSFRLDKTRK